MAGGNRCYTYMFSLQQDIYTSDDERPKPSAPPLKIAKVKVRVDWIGPIPDKWCTSLHKALQTWCNTDLSKGTGKYNVNSVTVMEDDPHCAEVQITPSEGET